VPQPYVWLLYKTSTCLNLSLKYNFILDTDTDKDTRDKFHLSIKAPINGTGLETYPWSYSTITTINAQS